MSQSVLHTVGHSNRPIDAFIAVLNEVGVRRLIDVRALPRSRRWPQYDGEALARSLAGHGIEYLWRGEVLGGFRQARADSLHVTLQGASRAFADHMETPKFAAAIDLLLDEAAHTPLAIMCAEKLPGECHRSLIGDYVLARGVGVVHLVDVGKRENGHLHPGARVVAGNVVYDRAAQLPLK